MKSFHYVPAVISAFLDDVHLFKLVLSHVCDKESSRGSVKREAPGIAESPSVNLRQPATGNKWIVRRNAVLQPWTRAVHVNPHHLAKENVGVLAVAKGIVRAAAIAEAEVEKPVRTEGELPCLVIAEVAHLV